MEFLFQILASLAVSAPAGFNAYLALLLVGIGGRVGWISLAAPYDVLQTTAALGVLVVLVTVETVADKVPALDSVNDIVGTAVRPAAGAVLFAGTNHALTDSAPLASLVLGALGAASLHAFKATTRPVWTASTGGLANPVVSVFEDLIVGATVVTGMFSWPVALAILVLSLGLGSLGILRLRGVVRRRLGAAR